MTREEAIARIKNHKIVHKMNGPRAIYISEALDMAIEAIEIVESLENQAEGYKDCFQPKSNENLCSSQQDHNEEVAKAFQLGLSFGFMDGLKEANKPQESEVEEKEPDSCDLCETIYPDDDTKDIAFRQGKYSNFDKYSFITIDDEGKYYVNGDPYKLGYLCDIKFCPCCGRKLVENEGLKQ